MKVVCQSCGKPLAQRAEGGRLKLYVRSRCVIVKASGEVEIRCHHCKNPTGLPLKLDTTLDTEENGSVTLGQPVHDSALRRP